MSSDEELEGFGSSYHFQYDSIFVIEFGSTWTKHSIFNILRGELLRTIDRQLQSVCLYTCDKEDYDNANFESYAGKRIIFGKKKILNGVYIDKLFDKLEYLCSMEPDINDLSYAKYRLYSRAIIKYLRELKYEVAFGTYYRQGTLNVMTYPSDWTSKQVANLRTVIRSEPSLGSFLFFSEGASILRLLQEPYMNENIKQGQRYLICNMGDSDIKSSLHDIEEALDTVDNIKSEIYRDWDINYMKGPSRLPLGEEDIVRSCITYLLSKLFPSSTTTDFLNREELRIFDDFAYDVLKDSVQNLCTKVIEKNEPSIYQIPISLQLKQQRLNNPNLACANLMESLYQQNNTLDREKDIQSEDMHILTVRPVEVVENVIKPIYERVKVNQYFQDVLRGAGDSIEAVILVGGGFCNYLYLVELIEDICKIEGTRVVCPHVIVYPSRGQSYSIAQGAIVKSMDKISADIRRPKVVLDKEFPIQSESKVLEVFVFIEYGDKISRASYNYPQQEQLPHGENIRHIVDWVEQLVLVWDFPTIEVMLIPSHKHDKTIRNLVSLKNNADHRNQFLELTKGDVAYNEYFTFRKGRQGVIMYTHSRDVTGKSTHTPDKDSRDQSNFGSCVNGTKHFSGTLVEAVLHPRVQTFDTHTNINGCDFTVTQKIITVQEFSTMYLKYLNTFLNDHIHLEIDARNYRFRFCITHVDTDGFRLTDEDIYLIANNLGMISTDLHLNNNTLLILKSEEATAVHCRELLNGFDVNDQVTYSNFVQVQLTETQCLILLNSFPIL